MINLDKGILQTTVTVSNLHARRLRSKLIEAFTENENLSMLGKMHEQIDASHTAQIELVAHEEYREIRPRMIDLDMDDCGD